MSTQKAVSCEEVAEANSWFRGVGHSLIPAIALWGARIHMRSNASHVLEELNRNRERAFAVIVQTAG